MRFCWIQRCVSHTHIHTHIYPLNTLSTASQYPSLSTLLSTHPINTPLNPPYQPTLSTHPINPPYQPTLSTHLINPPTLSPEQNGRGQHGLSEQMEEAGGSSVGQRRHHLGQNMCITFRSIHLTLTLTLTCALRSGKRTLPK